MANIVIFSVATVIVFLIGVFVGWSLPPRLRQIPKDKYTKNEKKHIAIDYIIESDNYLVAAISKNPLGQLMLSSVYEGSERQLKVIICALMSTGTFTEEAIIEAVKVYIEDKEKRENPK